MNFTANDKISLLALALLLLFLGGAVYKRHRVSQAAFLVVLGIFSSAAALLFPYYYFEHGSKTLQLIPEGLDVSGLLRALAYSVRGGLKTIGGGLDIDMVDDVVSKVYDFAVPFCRGVYKGMLYIYVGLAPLLTSTLLISFIGDFSERFRYFASFRRKLHIFSELNEESINIACRVKEKSPRHEIVFCEAGGANEALAIEAKKIKAIVLRSSCDGLRIHFWKRSLEFYLISGDGDKNLRLAEELIYTHRGEDRAIIVINAFVESGTGVQVVESMDKGRIGMRFIDKTALICDHLLLQEPLCKMPEGSSLASLMIVGCGKTGLRILKTTAWCGQALSYGLKIRVYDRNADFIEKEFRAQSPGLDEVCDIGFVKCDVDTDEFEKLVFDENTGSPDASYIFITTPDDEKNIELSERLYRLFRSHNHYSHTPRILTRVRSSIKSEIYVRDDNSYLEQRNIRFFGSLNSVFEQSTLFHSQLERLAFTVELAYNYLLPEKDPASMSLDELKAYLSRKDIVECRNNFMHSEYMRRSSMAAALHIPAKLHDCGVLEVGQPFLDDAVAARFEKLLEEDEGLLDSLACLEHSRWLAYMQSEGYRQADWEELLRFYPKLEHKNNQDKLSKRHLCIVGWEMLDELNEKYMSLNPPHKKDFKASDRNIVGNIPRLIRLTNRLEESDLDISVYP